ncbi:pantetheine-phosphate adenylyltransferase [Fundidesulfovibrio butyratiphilus]
MDNQGKLAIYPGTFDPLTMGHVSLVRRALKVFDRVVVAVANDTPKNPLYTLEERVDIVGEVFRDEPRVIAEGFHGLLVDYVRERKAHVVIRGMRAVSDFDAEFQMALMNRRLEPEIETIFFMTDFCWLFISSTVIKQVVLAGGDVTGLVPDEVRRRLEEKCRALNIVKK